MTDDFVVAERPTLATTFDLVSSKASTPDEVELTDLVRLAFEEHEPASTAVAMCPSCDAPMPCAVWSYAELESRHWMFTQCLALSKSMNERIASYGAET